MPRNNLSEVSPEEMTRFLSDALQVYPSIEGEIGHESPTGERDGGQKATTYILFGKTRTSSITPYFNRQSLDNEWLDDCLHDLQRLVRGVGINTSDIVLLSRGDSSARVQLVNPNFKPEQPDETNPDFVLEQYERRLQECEV